MDRDTWLKYYEASPEPVQVYLLDRESGRRESEAQERLAYDNDAWDRVMDAAWDAIFMQSSKQQFRDRIKAVAGDRKTEEVEKVLLLWVVLPLADLVAWDVESRLQELGVGQAELQSVPRVSLRPVSYGAAVRRIATLAKISLLGEEVVRRLRDAFVSNVKGVRTTEQFKEILRRSAAEGGLGFTQEQSDAFVKAMDEFRSTTQVLSEQEYADWYSTWQREGEEGSVKSGVGNVSSSTVSEDEVSAAIAGLPKSRGEGATALENAVGLALAQIGPTGLDEYLTRRLENVISTRLRDVRNPDQAKQILIRDQKVGGLGFPEADASRIAGVIEKVYADERQRILDDEKKRIESTVSEQQGKIDERKKRESEEHAKWYQEKVRMTKSQGSPEEQLAAALKQLSQQTPSSAPASKLQPTGTKQQMTDIIPPTEGVKLTGLTEELGGLTWAEFRRLAKDPDQAAQKIVEKLDTLKRESFERWTEGVTAWRQSPLQREYLKLIAESFAAGKPVAVLVESKREKDPSQPSADEIGAVIALNSRIQF